jgi:ATP-dependent Clp protease ATP-binding subunit ClpC
MTFERYTDRARRAVVLAQEEARATGSSCIGTGHLLMGLAAEDSGVASVALGNLGLNRGDCRKPPGGHGALDAPVPAGVPIPFTQATREALEAALRESLELGHPYIGTEHLLLGLLQDAGDGRAAQILMAAGITPADIRAEVRRLLGSFEEPDASVTPAPRRLRAGRTLGRTLYLITPGEDRKADTCIGLVDTREWADLIVAAVNAAAAGGEQ